MQSKLKRCWGAMEVTISHKPNLRSKLGYSRLVRRKVGTNSAESTCDLVNLVAVLQYLLKCLYIHPYLRNSSKTQPL